MIYASIQLIEKVDQKWSTFLCLCIFQSCLKSNFYLILIENILQHQSITRKIYFRNYPNVCSAPLESLKTFLTKSGFLRPSFTYLLLSPQKNQPSHKPIDSNNQSSFRSEFWLTHSMMPIDSGYLTERLKKTGQKEGILVLKKIVW